MRCGPRCHAAQARGAERASSAADARRELAIRIGVNTGEVMATTTPRPGEAMATGDAVNVAARLQQLAEPGAVLVAERTAAAARGFAFEPEPALDVRGKARAGALPSCWSASATSRTAGSRASRADGRPRRRARAAGQPAARGWPRRAGPPRHDLRRPGRRQEPAGARVHGDRRRALVRGRCLPYGDGITFWPLAEIAKDELGILDTDTPPTALDKVRERSARA